MLLHKQMVYVRATANMIACLKRRRKIVTVCRLTFCCCCWRFGDAVVLVLPFSCRTHVHNKLNEEMPTTEKLISQK